MCFESLHIAGLRIEKIPISTTTFTVPLSINQNCTNEDLLAFVMHAIELYPNIMHIYHNSF